MEEKLVLLSLNQAEIAKLLSALVRENLYKSDVDEDLKSLISKVAKKASEFNAG